MLQIIDNSLNRITMYRLVLYYLIVLFVCALYASSVGLIALDPFALAFSFALLLLVSWITNHVFSWIYAIPANLESVYISTLILALIITPPQSTSDYWFLVWAGILSMASKYIVAYKGKHIFNPVAFAVALTYFTTNQSASWWIGSPILLPIVIIGGLLVVRKIGRFDLVLMFLGSTLFFTIVSIVFAGSNLFTTLQNLILYSPFLFFSFIILTEPLTAPPTRKLRLVYGVLLGLLFIPQLHLGSFYFTPEIAILIGNIFSFVVSPKGRFKLRLRDKNLIASDVYEFTFATPKQFNFKPGQYMEWTLGHQDPDSRGNRRYFTLASAPSENLIRLGVKFYENSSTYKTTLLSMKRGDEIFASQLDGDFTLPENPKQKCVFIAGGIGITPFRSMLKHLLDTRQRRPITIFYAAHSTADIAYKEILERVEKELGIKTVYMFSNGRGHDSFSSLVGRGGNSGALLQSHVPAYYQCQYYLSGSRGMVESFRNSLHRIGIRDSQIKTDFFAGLS